MRLSLSALVALDCSSGAAVIVAVNLALEQIPRGDVASSERNSLADTSLFHILTG